MSLTPTRVRLSQVAVLAALAAACARDPEDAGDAGGPAARNLLLVTFDTTRADHLGCYGDADASTPTLDTLAREGALFERCFTVAPVTLPSHTSILTGLQPYHHGVRNNGTHHLQPATTTLAERLSAAGFATGAVVSAVVLDSSFGLDQGFDRYDDDLVTDESEARFGFQERPAAASVDRALAWVQERGDERWFLWLHLFDPHSDYDPPEPWAARFSDAPYDGEIAYADAQLGRLLDALRAHGELDETLVVMTADHGESLGDHGESTHSIFVYDSTTHVPLIMRHPALVPARRVREVVSVVDIAPTALELLGLLPASELDGRSLTGALQDSAPDLPARAAYSESMTPWYSHGWAELRTLRTAGERFIAAPRPELYDLRADPGELRNLLDADRDAAARWEARLRALLPEREADSRVQAGSDEAHELTAALEALGYTRSSFDEESTDRPDPKDRIELVERHQGAMELLHAGRLEDGERELRALLAEDPRALSSRGALVSLLEGQGRLEEAHAIWVEAADSPGFPTPALLHLAQMERELGLADWHAHVARAKQLNPHSATPWMREGGWALEDGDAAGSLRAWDEALARDPACAECQVGRSSALQAMGELDRAEAALLAALELDEERAATWHDLGVLAAADGRVDEARARYEEALAREPERLPTRVNLALLLAARGDVDGAEEQYRAALSDQPGNLAAGYNLAALLLQAGRAADALEVLAPVTAAHPDRPGPWRLVAAAARAVGDEERARAAQARVEQLTTAR